MGRPAIAEAFAVLAELALARGMRDLNKHPGVVEIEIDARWKATLNPHKEPALHDGISLPAYTAVINYNGWPAGMICPFGGMIAAGECANETTFIAAMRRQIEAATPEQQEGS